MRFNLKTKALKIKARLAGVHRLRSDIPQWVSKKTDRKVTFGGRKTNWKRNRINVK